MADTSFDIARPAKSPRRQDAGIAACGSRYGVREHLLLNHSKITVQCMWMKPVRCKHSWAASLDGLPASGWACRLKST